MENSAVEQLEARLPHKQEVVSSNLTRAKKFERVGQLLIRPLLLRKERSAFDLARDFYAMYNDLDFEADLVEYLREGYVISRPHLFAMVRPILHEGERIWYIRIVIGNLLEAISCLPCMLPKLAYCRNNRPDKMVIVDTNRLIEVSKQTAERNGSNELIREAA